MAEVGRPQTGDEKLLEAEELSEDDEELLRIVSDGDQLSAEVAEVARATARYWSALVAQGVPRALAARIVSDWSSGYWALQFSQCGLMGDGE